MNVTLDRRATNFTRIATLFRASIGADWLWDKTVKRDVEGVHVSVDRPDESVRNWNTYPLYELTPFRLTDDQSILYVADLEMLRAAEDGTVYEMRFGFDAHHGIVNVSVSVTVVDGGANATCFEYGHIACAEYTMAEECRASCGPAAGGGAQCHWVPQSNKRYVSQSSHLEPLLQQIIR